MSPMLIDHLYVVAITVAFLLAIFKSQLQIGNRRFTTHEKIGMYWANSLFLYAIAAVAVLIWWWPGRSLADIGFRMPGENVVMYLGLTIVFLVWLFGDATFKLVSPARRREAAEKWRRQLPFMPETSQEMPHALHIAVCAGITEEIVFRGFLITYFVSLFSGSSLQTISEPLANWQVWLAILIPAVMFGLSHMYQGWSGVFKVIFLSVMFGGIFVTSGSLVVVVALHIMVDVLAILISPAIMAETSPPAETSA